LALLWCPHQRTVINMEARGKVISDEFSITVSSNFSFITGD